MTTIVLADDHAVLRQGLRAVLEAEPDFSVIGEASDGLGVADLVARVNPHVLVLDLLMPGLNGLDALRQVSRRSPRTRVVILSMHDNESYVLNALRLGASAYVLKNASADELVRAIREVTAGRRYLSPPLSERAMDGYAEKARAVPLDVYETLTDREREVLHLAAEGHANAQIGARLFISPRTVETHRASLMRKLGLRTYTDLARFALRRGILPGA